MGKKNIIVGSEKGGTGKSLLAVNLAVMFHIAGYKTILVDSDSQPSSFRFSKHRAVCPEAFFPLPTVPLLGSSIKETLIDLSVKYDVVIVDCGGRDSMELRSAMLTPCINLMIIPICADNVDLETLGNMDYLVRVARIYNSLDVKCLINKCPTNIKLATMVEEAKSFITDDVQNLGLLETKLYTRINYSYAFAKGLGVIEYERGLKECKATSEMLSLYKEITNDDYPIDKIIYPNKEGK